jgi:2-dehydro-3-deoxyglucarate aldolase/4-hydroxy-2-oxoheptanedioate aldolase
MLRQSAPLVGLTTQHVTQAWLAKLWKQSGCDFIYMEYEHGFFNEGRLAEFVLCCRAEGLPVVAKVPECSRTHVAKLLESGVIGIQLPWSETREQIDRLVSYVKFQPIGIRAAAPGYGNCDYSLDVDGRRFIEESNRETVVLAHVETRLGVENIDAILSSPHVDVVFLGMYDLSASFKNPGNFQHPDVVAAVERVIASARRHSKVIGMYVPDAEAAARWFARGVTFFETASEVELIGQGARSLVKQFRSIGAGVKT